MPLVFITLILIEGSIHIIRTTDLINLTDRITGVTTVLHKIEFSPEDVLTPIQEEEQVILAQEDRIHLQARYEEEI